MYVMRVGSLDSVARVPAAGKASADTRHVEQTARLVASRSEQRIGALHDVVERITAQEHGHIILFQAHRPKASRWLIARKRPGFLNQPIRNRQGAPACKDWGSLARFLWRSTWALSW
ncbi:hypothetical protein [Dictyobacter formicarum]|uniref:Uncharacterized protein n=1 Tax=Dictyobacter formicarum TaxID=2778368 RepID=A0ABQ3V8L0_9CHLR|nr:hypothetical protein [Dictyobacter formicarum]GHO81998.1 hypothetical protein KSZ_00040 [Dictyobacter formicarum]